MKFHIDGTKTVEVSTTIEAENQYEAKELFEDMDVCLDCMDGEITITESNTERNLGKLHLNVYYNYLAA